MRKLKKYNRFFFYQFLCALAVVLICTLISGMISYQILYDNFEKWTTQTNSKLMDQYENYINRTLATGTNEIYIQILNQINSTQTFNYYSSELDQTDLLHTLDVQSYLSGIRNSSPIFEEISIYYPKNNLLITNDRIRYTLFYESRQADIQPYSELLQTAGYRTDNSFYVYSDEDTINMVHTVNIGSQIRAGVFIKYSISKLRSMLNASIPFDEGNVILADADGNVLFDQQGVYTGRNLTDEEAMHPAMEGSGRYTTDLLTQKSVVSYKTGVENWRFIVIVPIDTMTSPINFILRNLLISALITVLLGLIFAALLSGWQSRPMKSIIELCDLTGIRGKDTYGTIKGALSRLMSLVEAKEARLERIMPLLRDDFIYWLLTESPADKGEIDDRMLFSQVSFPHRNFCIVAVKTNADEAQYEHAMAYARLTLQQAFTTEHSLCGLCKRNDLILGLVNFDYPYDDIIGLNRSVLEQSGGEYRYYYAVGHLAGDLSTLAGTVTQTVNSLKYSFVYPERCFFTPEFMSKMDQEYHSGCRNLLLDFAASLRNCDAPQAVSTLGRIIDDVRSAGCCLEQLRSVMMELTGELEEFSGYKPALNREMLRLVNETPDILCFVESFSEIITDEIQIKADKSSHSSAELVEACVSYIEAHLLDSQLSLTSVACELGVTPNYMSRIFHEVNGITFVEHLVSVKLNYGRKLLTSTNLSLRDISEKLNYASPQYFISRFKKQFGLTPSVFRENSKNINLSGVKT